MDWGKKGVHRLAHNKTLDSLNNHEIGPEEADLLYEDIFFKQIRIIQRQHKTAELEKKKKIEAKETFRFKLSNITKKQEKQ
jgi:hypothetical protein